MTAVAEDTPAAVAKARDAAWSDLSDIPHLWADLDDFVTLGSRPAGGGGRARGSYPSQPPVNLGVIALQRETVDRVSRWVRQVDEVLVAKGSRHARPSQSPTMRAGCAFLRGHLVWIFEQPSAAQWAADVASLSDRLRRATGADSPPRVRVSCPVCGSGVEQLDGGASYRCPACDRTWVMSAEVDRLVAVHATALTLRECAERVGRPLSTLKQWRRDGLLPRAGERLGVGLYDPDVVDKLAESQPERRRQG